MAYGERNPRERSIATLAVAAVHALLGFAFVTGMPGVAMQPIRERTLTGITLPPAAESGGAGDPATSEGVPEGVIVQRPAPTPLAPPGQQVIGWSDGVIRCFFDFDEPPEQTAAAGDYAGLSDGPAIGGLNPVPANDKATWFGPDDIPNGIGNLSGGWMSYRLAVGANGGVEQCEISRASSIPALDAALCAALTARARFEPARDYLGVPVAGHYDGTVRWRLPD